MGAAPTHRTGHRRSPGAVVAVDRADGAEGDQELGTIEPREAA
jgi:hypothetical protein